MLLSENENILEILAGSHFFKWLFVVLRLGFQVKYKLWFITTWASFLELNYS